MSHTSSPFNSSNGGIGNRREQLNAATQETRFVLLSTIIGHPSELPTLEELSYANPSKSKSTIRNHLDTLTDTNIVEKIKLPKEKRQRDLPSTFYGITEEGYEILENNDLIATNTVKDMYEMMEKTDKIRRYEEAPRPKR